eukprot:14777229-Alexandrium_andersonii.AAC.1
MPRAELAERTRKEYLKTADAVEAEPWCMAGAARFLRDLASPQALGSAGDLPDSLDWLGNLNGRGRNNHR